MSEDVKTVVYLDMARYSAISRSLQELHGLGTETIEKLNAQIHGFVREAADDVGVVLDDVFVKSTGDGAILAFSEPALADRFAEVLHHRADEHNRPTSHENERRLFRVGIYSGELRRTADGDVAGTVIGKAARLEGAAKTGEVVIDAESWEDLPEEQKRAYGPAEFVQGKVHDPEFRVRRRRVTPDDRADDEDAELPPNPTFRDLVAERLSTRLEGLYSQREQVIIDNEDTRTLDNAILDVKRQLRKGPQLQPGEFLLDGRFRLINTLGQGGFAMVWRAYDRQLKRLVAVKVLHGQHSEDRTRRERFFRGARKMEELHHPNIVRVLEPMFEDDDWFFFVMEIITGGNLNQAVLGSGLTDEEKLAIVFQVGEALEFAHQQGVVHRDVKPSNILLEGRSPKLTDFDLVLAKDTTGLTRTRAMLGTLNYAAPEVLESAKSAGPPADVYSLASTAVFTLLGKPLPRGYYRDPGAAIESLRCPPAIAQVLIRATVQEQQRFASAAAFVSALKEATKDSTVVKPPQRSPPAVVTSSPSKARRGRWAAFVAAVTVIVAATVWSWQISAWRKADAARTETFLYKTLENTLQNAAENADLRKIDQITRDARDYYLSLNIGIDRSPQLEALALHYEGEVLDYSDRLTEAENAFSKAVALRRKVLDPSSPLLLEQLGDSLTELGVVQQHSGNYTAATLSYGEANERLSKAFERLPGNSTIARKISVTILRQARLAQLQAEGDYSEDRKEEFLAKSLHLLQKGKALIAEMREVHAQSSEWDFLYAFALSRLARLEKNYNNDLIFARTLFEEALSIRVGLSESHPENGRYILHVAMSYDDLARLEVVENNLVNSLESSEKARSMFATYSDGEIDDKRATIYYAEQALLSARIHRTMGNESAVIRLLDEVEYMFEVSISDSESKDLLNAYAEACLRNGKKTNRLMEALGKLKRKGAARPEVIQLAREAKLW